MFLCSDLLMKIKVGDIVGRKSYNKDIYFMVDRIFINSKNKKIAVLKGLNIRIIADSKVEDLELFTREEILDSIKYSESYLENRIEKSKTNYKRMNNNIYTGKILHLDGDRKYSEKSARYYNKMGLVAVVKNIQENRQANVVVSLLNKYNPDILIVTGHDAMFKKGKNYNNIYNYRNSRAFYKYCKRGKKMGEKFK